MRKPVSELWFLGQQVQCRSSSVTLLWHLSDAHTLPPASSLFLRDLWQEQEQEQELNTPYTNILRNIQRRQKTAFQMLTYLASVTKNKSITFPSGVVDIFTFSMLISSLKRTSVTSANIENKTSNLGIHSYVHAKQRIKKPIETNHTGALCGQSNLVSIGKDQEASEAVTQESER